MLNLGFAPFDVDKIIVKLQDEGLLSDQRFVQAYCRYKYRAGFGPLKIVMQLRAKGISDYTAVIDEYDWYSLAVYLRWRRFGLDDCKDRTKQMRYLKQRGFSLEQINYALEQEKIDESFVIDFNSIN